MNHNFHPTTLREYDIRGVIDETLTAQDAYAIGRSFGTIIRRAGGSTVVTGYDGRLSSPMLEDALNRGLTESGCDVVRVGLGPTPMLYYAECVIEGADGGIQITGSHNPPNYNGFKMVQGHGPFYGADIQKIGALSAAGDWECGTGRIRDVSIFDQYVDRIATSFTGTRNYRIGWDAGNGAAGAVIEALVKRLPGEHFTLFTEIDGEFPNHHPDPTVPENLVDLQKLVAEKKLDFGVAFDGDGDRIGAIDGQGRIVWGDQLLGILAEPVLKKSPGAVIIADVKASQALFDKIAELGGQPLMWKTGHSLVKAKMKETKSPIAGEMSGHIFFAQDYYGFDDAIYGAVALMNAVDSQGGSLTALKDAMPAMVNTPELRFQVDETRKFAVIDEVLARLKESGATVDHTDGARVNTPDGWWLLRASNTQDVLVARAEAKDQAGLDRLLTMIDDQLAASGLERGESVGH